MPIRINVAFLKNLALGLLGALLCISGNAGQVIALNFWLASFPTGPAPFAVLTVVASTVAIAYGTVLGIYVLVKRPALGFAIDPRAIAIGTLCGFFYSLNGVLLVYATPDTPELLQAMLLSTGVFWTFLATGALELLFKRRAALNGIDVRALLVPFSFGLCVAGIVVGVGSYHVNTLTFSQKKWTMYFALAQIPGAFYNVAAARYMNRFSRKPEDDAMENQPLNAFLPSPTVRKSDPTTVKFMLLVVSSVTQVMFLWAYFPLDWTPGFGHSADGAAAAKNLRANYQCTFKTCDNGNFSYFVAFTLSYAAALGGLAILNHISAPLCSMVTQIAAPAASVIMLVFPSLNQQDIDYEAGEVVGGVILITAGSLVYVLWAQFLQKRTPPSNIVASSPYVDGVPIAAQYPQAQYTEYAK